MEALIRFLVDLDSLWSVRKPDRRPAGAVLLSAVIASGLAGGTARAQGSEERVDEEARSLFHAGESAFSQGRYEAALEHFQAAYELSPRPELLFNIGNTAERLRREEEALEAYRRYLAAQPDAENRAQVEARIQIIENAIAERENGGGTTTVVPEGGGGRVVTWVFAGMAVAFGGLATVSWVVGENEYNDLNERCTNAGGCTDEEVDASSVPVWDVLTNVSIGLAAACLAAGVVFFFVEGWGGGDDEADVAVGLSPGGLLVRGRF
jgi:tetratricopeptide (TPR) repeat protein